MDSIIDKIITVLAVKATDGDEGDFGHVTYSLSGTYKNSFSIGSEDGMISVVDPAVLDREEIDTITLQVSLKIQNFNDN